MKKLLLLLCSFVLAVSTLTACEIRGRIEPSNTTTENPADEQEEGKEDAKTYVVTLNADGGVLESKEGNVTKDKAYTLPTPTRTGYTFVEWKDDKGVVYPLTGTWTKEGSVTLKAYWTANTYKITFNLDGGSLPQGAESELTATYDQAPPALPTPTKSGYTFSSWTYEGKSLPAIWNLTENVCLLANWQAEQQQTCTITFTQDGEADIVKTVAKGGTLTDIPTPKDTDSHNYVWESKDFTNITENMTVKAVATAKIFTVTYDANGGTVSVPTQNIQFGTSYTLATPTKTGFVFAGWENEEGQVVANEGTSWNITEHVTLTAKWTLEEEKTYTIKLIVENGKLPNGKTDTLTVELGQSYDLTSYKPTYDDPNEKSFSRWVFKGTNTKVPTSGTWEWGDYADGAIIELEVKWASNWTGFY